MWTGFHVLGFRVRRDISLFILFYVTGSNMGPVWPLRGPLTMSVDSLSCHSGEWGATGIEWVGQRSC